jgi:hypothetical protein
MCGGVQQADLLEFGMFVDVIKIKSLYICGSFSFERFGFCEDLNSL